MRWTPPGRTIGHVQRVVLAPKLAYIGQALAKSIYGFQRWQTNGRYVEPVTIDYSKAICQQFIRS